MNGRKIQRDKRVLAERRRQTAEKQKALTEYLDGLPREVRERELLIQQYEKDLRASRNRASHEVRTEVERVLLRQLQGKTKRSRIVVKGDVRQPASIREVMPLKGFDRLLRVFVKPENYERYWAGLVYDAQRRIWDARRSGDRAAARREYALVCLSLVRFVPRWIVVLLIKLAIHHFRSS